MKYAAMTVMLAAQLAGAPPAPTVHREVDLNQILPGKAGYMPVTRFAFSPDEKWLAITMYQSPVDPRRRGASIGEAGTEVVVLVAVDGADSRVRIEPGLRSTGGPQWSPGSDAFAVGGLGRTSRDPHTGGILKAWNLRGEELFRREEWSTRDILGSGGFFGFLDPGHVLIRAAAAKGMPVRFETLDLHGQVMDTWTAPKHWTLRDISVDGRRLAVSSDERSAQTLVVDAASKKVVLTKDDPYGLQLGEGGSAQYFAEGGKTLCSVGSVLSGPTRKDTLTECWDIDSGKKIAQFSEFRGGVPAAASAGGSRLVLTNPLFSTKKKVGSASGYYGERIVWDFRAGAQVAKWNMPQFFWSNESGSIEYPSNGPVAISAKGRYVAEEEGVLLKIYEIP